MEDKKDDEKPDENNEGRHRDKDTEEINSDGQQEGRPLPPPDDGHEKH